MKIPIVRKLAETYGLEELEAAEASIMEGENPSIDVPGDDEGERLTHAMAAIWVKRAVIDGMEAPAALRAYAEKVRKSIS